ncbi:hypothetical protein AM571_PC01539 (plasmid) [Rhizobium etli 8C-3]|uniref:Uncharacterized protein n=1 Tax=Rhizobium etli 8C-3 TaxID=538025 RepID=A0A1L5PGH4_RHIET|nr:hypothetical protein AM571_PC01539 [Rhizobium etli 8C-3]
MPPDPFPDMAERQKDVIHLLRQKLRRSLARHRIERSLPRLMNILPRLKARDSRAATVKLCCACMIDDG